MPYLYGVVNRPENMERGNSLSATVRTTREAPIRDSTQSATVLSLIWRIPEKCASLFSLSFRVTSVGLEGLEKLTTTSLVSFWDTLSWDAGRKHGGNHTVLWPTSLTWKKNKSYKYLMIREKIWTGQILPPVVLVISCSGHSRRGCDFLWNGLLNLIAALRSSVDMLRIRKETQLLWGTNLRGFPDVRSWLNRRQTARSTPGKEHILVFKEMLSWFLKHPATLRRESLQRRFLSVEDPLEHRRNGEVAVGAPRRLALARIRCHPIPEKRTTFQVSHHRQVGGIRLHDSQADRGTSYVT